MAARLNKFHTDTIREKIKVSQLITRLQKYSLGEIDDSEITPNRMRAIEILLRKSLPDLSAIQISGDADSPLTIQTIERVIIEAKDTDS